MVEEICVNCGEEIVGERIPFMPGKVPGAYRERWEEEIPHTKKRLVVKDVEVENEVNGVVVVSVERRTVEEDYTYVEQRTVEGEWKAGGKS